MNVRSWSRSSLALACALSAFPATTALGQDADGDGALDAADAYPCDGTRAAASFYPAEDASALLVFEDQWPDDTDLDFNDVAVRVNYRADRNAIGNVTRLLATFDPVAVGGQLTNGLGLQLPVARGTATVRRRIGGGAWQTVALESDANATMVVSPTLRELYGNAEGRINSIPTDATITGQRLELEVTFSGGVALNTAQAPFDVFIFRADDFAHQIHFPQYAGTAAMNTALFGSGEDASTAQRHFVHLSGVPAALNLMTTSYYPQEAIDVGELFPSILGFASSAGAANQDFYLSNVVTSRGLTIAAPAIAVTTADRSCLGRLDVDTEPLSFSTLPTLSASRVVAVSNAGPASLVISAINLTGAGAARFTTSGCTPPFTLGQGATCNLTITFAPDSSASNVVAAVNLVHSGRNATQQIALIGDGSFTPAFPAGASGATPPTISGYTASWTSGASHGGFTIGGTLRNQGRFVVGITGTAASMNALEYNIQTQTAGTYYGLSFSSGNVVRAGADIIAGSANGASFARPTLANNDRILMAIDFGARNLAYYHCPASTGQCAATPFHSVNGIVPSTRSLRIYQYKTGSGAASVTIGSTNVSGLPAALSSYYNGLPH